jgi:hypothetical protein
MVAENQHGSATTFVNVWSARMLDLLQVAAPVAAAAAQAQ